MNIVNFEVVTEESNTKHVWKFEGSVDIESDEQVAFFEELVQGGESYRHMTLDDLPYKVRAIVEFNMGFRLVEE